jgi:hypothetical protein
MFEAKLQMRLMSGEPKCANCGHWYRHYTDGPRSMFGLCTLVTPMEEWKAADEPPVEGWLTTTDLSVCSKWEMPDGKQAKVETPSE